MREKTLNWQLVIDLVCLALLAIGLLRQIVPQNYQAPDFTHTYDAALAMRHGDNLYAPALAWVESYAPGNPFTDQYFYAPTFALLLMPLTFLPYQTALSVWGVCLLALLFGSVYALLRSTGSRPRLVDVLVLTTAASFMSAVRAEYFLGQANLFMVACICAAVWARQAQRPGLAGTLLALAFVTKPMLLLIGIYLLWKREFRLFFGTVAGFLVLFLTPFLWLGRRVLGDLLILWHFYSTRYLSFT